MSVLILARLNNVLAVLRKSWMRKLRNPIRFITLLRVKCRGLSGAVRRTSKIAHQAAPTTHNAGGEPSDEQSDDDPGDDAHIPHPELRCSRKAKSIQPTAKSERTCAGLYAGFQHNDDTPATTTFESERP